MFLYHVSGIAGLYSGDFEMTFFNYLDLHPFLSFIWFCLIVSAVYGTTVMIIAAAVNIIRTPRSPAIVTEMTRHRGF